jgi:hypothetical protein
MNGIGGKNGWRHSDGSAGDSQADRPNLMAIGPSNQCGFVEGTTQVTGQTSCTKIRVIGGYSYVIVGIYQNSGTVSLVLPHPLCP